MLEEKNAFKVSPASIMLGIHIDNLVKFIHANYLSEQTIIEHNKHGFLF